MARRVLPGLGIEPLTARSLILSALLGSHPRVMLPIITYNLVQHLMAGVVAFLLARMAAGKDAPSADAEVGSILVTPSSVP